MSAFTQGFNFGFASGIFNGIFGGFCSPVNSFFQPSCFMFSGNPFSSYANSTNINFSGFTNYYTPSLNIPTFTTTPINYTQNLTSLWSMPTPTTGMTNMFWGNQSNTCGDTFSNASNTTSSNASTSKACVKTWNKMTEGEMIATYGNYSRSITETYKGTEADLNKFLSDKGVLKGKAKTFIAAAKKYNISAAALAAICVHESGRGTSSLAVKKNNIGGIRPKGDNKNFRTFSSIDECIEFIAKLLRNNYANIGLTKLYQVNAKYCPVLTEADINGTNGLWARQVNYFLEQIDKVHA